MINLPKWRLTNPFPAFLDAESGTAIEQTAKLYGAMQTLIEEYNKWVESVNANLKDFAYDTKEDQEIFATALRQEFQDFIDTVTLKLVGYDGSIDDFEDLINRKCKEYLNAAIASGAITLEPVYNEETESLDYTLSGKVV